jgi:hypothetical protein
MLKASLGHVQPRLSRQESTWPPHRNHRFRAGTHRHRILGQFWHRDASAQRQCFQSIELGSTLYPSLPTTNVSNNSGNLLLPNGMNTLDSCTVVPGWRPLGVKVFAP